MEYPLREAECSPDRHHGLGLLVGRNMDRGDAKTLPAERLDLCEIEPLQQEEAGSSRSASLASHGSCGIVLCAEAAAGLRLRPVMHGKLIYLASFS